ncbi:uncharacterized protein CIMG_04026 [Coccidioides immitis RS]|uniref:Uncharacterized protein n=1 Tax=Coccidioides immitis (strain RS) TaxID=246410 RepID=J3KCM4_COCIM|nr:uncharacterized protein CIMG_04026 [Coccidioides immitis RS]EAS33002.3 hypothetical protein CIMG_04026 [Coccidioides immitis RS]
MWHPVLRFSTRCLTARFVLRLALTNLVAGRTLDIFEEAGHEGISSCLIVAVRLVSSDSTQDPESFVYDGRGVSIASLYGVLPRSRRAGRIVWNGLHHRVKDVIDVVTPHPMSAEKDSRPWPQVGDERCESDV